MMDLMFESPSDETIQKCEITAASILGLEAPLRLNIPDGAGEGAALCFTLFDAGIKAYKEMETFEEASVHVEVKEFSLAEQNKNTK